MSARSSSSTPQMRFSRARSPRATRSRWSINRAMHGSYRSASFACSAMHSARSRAPTPVGSKVWIVASTALHPGQRHAQPVGDVEQRGGQVPRIVDLVDQMRGDAHVRPGVDRRARLRHQVIRETPRGVGEGIEVHRLAAARRRRAAAAQRAVEPAAAVRCAVLTGGFRWHSRGPAVRPTAVPVTSASAPAGSGASGRSGVVTTLPCPASSSGLRSISSAMKVLDLEVGQREQLDRLLQLRRHHQRLRLPQVEARGEAHLIPSPVGRGREPPKAAEG